MSSEQRDLELNVWPSVTLASSKTWKGPQRVAWVLSYFPSLGYAPYMGEKN